jgi:hypothetical protein
MKQLQEHPRSPLLTFFHFGDRPVGRVVLINEKSRHGKTSLKGSFTKSAYRSTRRLEITALRFLLSSVLSVGF